MGVNHWLSSIGGFAYGYSGFFIIGYAAGHNAKVNTAAFIPLMILALLLILEKKNWRAFILMAVFAGLSIHRNHFQITYYAGLFMAIIWLVYLIQYAKEKALHTFAKYTGLIALVVYWLSVQTLRISGPLRCTPPRVCAVGKANSLKRIKTKVKADYPTITL